MALSSYIPMYDIKSLDFESSTKTISLEASELGICPGLLPHGRLYHDAYDEGVKLRNSDTGKESIWVHTMEDKQDGDVMGWHYQPTTESLRHCPSLKGWTLLIIND